MQHRILSSIVAAALVPLAGGRAIASETLFPELPPEAFPERANEVRFGDVAALPGSFVAADYRLRPAQVGFAGRLSAQRSFDPVTRRPVLTVSRLDDDCIAAAEEARLPADEVCPSAVASEIASGVQRVVLTSRLVNYQVQFTMVREPGSAERWTVLPTGRTGEPRVLAFEAGRGADDGVDVAWSVLDTGGRDESIELPLRATIARADAANSDLTPFELGVLLLPDLLYDLGDYYKDWIVYSENQIVDEGIPGPDDNDNSQCELMETVCGAEHDTCIPTPDGWVGCDYGPPPNWGGGYEPPNRDPPPQTLPDWKVGSLSTSPPFPKPLFNGIDIVYDANGNPRRVLNYSLTSVLQRKDTVAKPYPPGSSIAALFPAAYSHMVKMYLATYSGLEPTEPPCGHGRHSDTQVVPVGDYELYEPYVGAIFDESHGEYPGCKRPRPGTYKMRYELDWKNLWNEGPTGEANNIGNFRGYYVETGH